MSRRISSQMKTLRIIVIVAVCAIVAVVNYCKSAPAQHDIAQSEIPGRDELLTVITPSGITSTPLSYTGMNIGFNPTLHIPNWVAWELTADETDGTEPRKDSFQADTEVNGSATPADYVRSGYDRGHMAPAADMKWHKTAIEESFKMTNIVPQAKSLNSGTWKKLEEKCRTWAKADGRIYIVCGPVINDKPIEYIGESNVYVPRRFFKVILSLDGDKPRGIGFIMPNGKVPGGMQAAAVSIDKVEQITGYDFFASLPDDIETAVESQCDFNRWSTISSAK